LVPCRVQLRRQESAMAKVQELRERPSGKAGQAQR